MKQCLSLRRVALSLVLLVSIVGWALPSSAHRIKVFAYGEGGEVVAKSYFSSGKAVMHAPVAVYDDRNGDTLIKGKTDENGIFRFPVPVHAEQKRMDLKIIVNTGEGHRAEWLLTADEYLEKSGDNDTRGGISTIDQERPMQQVLHVAESTSSSCDEEMIATLVEQALDKKLAPIKEMLQQDRGSGPDFRDILGGIGYIVGLAGIAVYLGTKKTRRNDH